MQFENFSLLAGWKEGSIRRQNFPLLGMPLNSPCRLNLFTLSGTSAEIQQESNWNSTEIQGQIQYKSLLVFHGWPCRLNLFTWSSTNGNHHRLVLWLLHYRILSITYRFFSLWTCITSTQFKTKCKYDYIYTDTNNIRLVIVIIWGLKCRVWDGIFSLGAATRIF